jgi:DNA-binding response OmpR family regulator
MAHVLLIEPDRLLAETYMTALLADGHTAQPCVSAQSAVFCVDEQMPDIIIMELQLTGHSGIEFLYELRSYADWRRIPVIVLSGIPAGEFQGSWSLLRKQLGVESYHYKPLTSLKDLLVSVRDGLAAHPQLA